MTTRTTYRSEQIESIRSNALKKIVKPGKYILPNGDTLWRIGYNRFQLLRKPDPQQIKRLQRLSREQLFTLAQLPCYRRRHIKLTPDMDKEELIQFIASRDLVHFHLSFATASQSDGAQELLDTIRQEV